MSDRRTLFPDATLELDDDALQELIDLLERPPRADEPRSRGLLRRLVPGPLRMPLRVAATAAVRPRTARTVRSSLSRRPVRLHLGSGTIYKPDWINIDLFPARADMSWNLAAGIPFPDESVDAIMHEHVLEHFTLRDGYALTCESYRVLRPAGILRVGVPDAGQALQSYAGNWASDWARSAPTGMIAVQQLFYESGHRAMYDGQTLELLHRAAGFAEVRRHAFGEGRLQPNADSPARRGGTLYIEAVKAADDRNGGS